MPRRPTPHPMPGLVLDATLAALLVWVAWRALSHHDLFVSIVLFIAFGLVMALVWVRLGAADIALAEATIGSGITGALLLDASGFLRRREAAAERGVAPMASGDGRTPRSLRVITAFLTLAAGAGLLRLMMGLPLPESGSGLEQMLAREMEEIGLKQPVTAVLVAFRGYDTLLEMTVLLLAAVAMLSARRERDLRAIPLYPPDDPVVVTAARLLTGMLVLTAGHLLLLGTRSAGGGFQAGAVLAATGVLLLLAGSRSVAALGGWRLRAGLTGGLALFLAIGAAGELAVAGAPVPALVVTNRAALVLLVELGMMVAVGATLAALVAGARPFSTASGDARRDTRTGEAAR